MLKKLLYQNNMEHFKKSFSSGLDIFRIAYQQTKKQMLVSVILLLIITAVFTLVMYFAEKAANKDYSMVDALVWTFVKYVEDPAEVAVAPMTIIGQITGTLVGVLGVAIFAVPAGLIGSGLIDAMDKQEREEELDEYRKRMRKAFRRKNDKSLRTYLNELPEEKNYMLKQFFVSPQRINTSTLQVRQGMELKDIIDACRKYPEFRIKDLATAHSDEDEANEHFVVEHFPLNKRYGTYIDRNSKVTIVSTNSFDEMGVGWFTYYLAKFGGFNYISKDIEVDPDELDSYYNMSPDALYNQKKRSEYTKSNKEAVKILEHKKNNREEFLNDLKEAASKDGAWVIIVTTHLKTTENTSDFHFAASLKNGEGFTVNNQDAYNEFLKEFEQTMKERYGMETQTESARYPLLGKNLAYRINAANSFVLRPSTELINFNTRKLTVAYIMAQIIGQHFDPGHTMTPEDKNDLMSKAFGFSENPTLEDTKTIEKNDKLYRF